MAGPMIAAAGMIAAAAAVVGCGSSSNGSATPAAQASLTTSSPTVQSTPKVIKIDPGNNPSKGPANAKVTIVEFSDFQGPNCGKFAQQTLPQIISGYGDKVRFVFVNHPLSKDSYAQKAAEAGECANAQGSFWQYHDLLFQNQQVLTGLLTPDPTAGLTKIVDSLKGYATQLGLDSATFNDCLDSGKMTTTVQADQQLAQKASQDAGLSTFPVPAFFINGTYLSGAKPIDTFKPLIDAALAQTP